MNQPAIVITSDGAKAMGFSSDFRAWAEEQGIRDPFRVSMDLASKRWKRQSDGSVSMEFEWDKNGRIKEDPAEPTRAEKDAYIKMRDEYTARRCFYEIGYESFLFHTKPHDYECNYDISYMREQNEFVPCKSADGQCSFYCPQYWCCIRGIWTPD